MRSEIVEGPVYSSPGEMAQREPGPEQKSTTEPPREGHSAPNVLLAEDESAVRGVARRILERAGCTVVEARDGDEALREFRRAPDEFDILVTDLVMPKLGGWDLADRMIAVRPELPIVFMSGYVSQTDARNRLREGSDVFIQKPFRAEELVAAVRNALRLE